MDDLLEQGIAAYKAGKRDEARKIFIAVVKQSPDNERAWGWMYMVANDDKERIRCMKQALRINPANEKAKQLLDTLTKQGLQFAESSQIAVPPMQAQVNTVMPVAQNEKAIQTKSQEDSNTGMKKCPYCAEWILQDAIVCRFCGRELPNKKIAADTPPTAEKIPPPKKAVNNFPCVVIVIGIVSFFFIACLFFAALGSATSTTGNSVSPATPNHAVHMCEYFVTKRLKAPSTAKFAPYEELEITTYGKNEGVKDAFRVKGYVDAQNGFGAMIRSDYICDIQYVGNDNWNIINLTIE